MFLCLSLLGLLCCTSFAVRGQAVRAGDEYRTTYLPLVFHNDPVVVISKIGSSSINQYFAVSMGVIENLTSTQAYSVTIEAFMHNDIKNYTTTLGTFFPVTLPNVPNYFSNWQVIGQDYLLSADIKETLPLTSTNATSLAVSLNDIECGNPFYGWAVVEGSVLNNTSKVVQPFGVAAWRYKLVNVDKPFSGYAISEGEKTFPSDTILQPGETITFTMTLSEACSDGTGRDKIMLVGLDELTTVAQGYVLAGE